MKFVKEQDGYAQRSRYVPCKGGLRVTLGKGGLLCQPPLAQRV